MNHPERERTLTTDSTSSNANCTHRGGYEDSLSLAVHAQCPEAGFGTTKNGMSHRIFKQVQSIKFSAHQQ